MPDHHLTLERPYSEQDPLDMADAREASRRMARIRREREADHREAIDDAAMKEAEYRSALAKEMVRLTVEEKKGATVAKELAHEAKPVHDALIAHKVSIGMVKAHEARLTGTEGERSMLKSLIDYSARVNAALREPDSQREGPTFGRRAA